MTDTLRNGAIVKAEIRVKDVTYVTAFFNGEYVCWCIDADRNAYFGRYFGAMGYKRALKVMFERAERLL